MKLEEQLTCDECGKYGAVAFGGKDLCPDCYAIAGTCGGGMAADEEANKD